MKTIETADNHEPHADEQILAILRLLVRALSYEIAPSLESIRSNTELLKGEESRICVHTRLCHIAQEVVRIGRVLQKAQHLSVLRVKTTHGITMLDLEETVEKRSLAEWERETEERERMIRKVRNVMTYQVQSCGPDTNLAAVAKIMWDNDCGAVPVVDREGKVIGMVTDRDICIATATKQRIASAIVVGELLSGKLHFCLPEDDLTTALLLMQTEQVRRLPVVNVKGMLEGILSINDIILYAEKSLPGEKKAALSYEEVLKTLKGICAHR